MFQEFVATLVRQRDMFRQLFEQLSGRQGGGSSAGGEAGGTTRNGAAAHSAAGALPVAAQQVQHCCLERTIKRCRHGG